MGKISTEATQLKGIYKIHAFLSEDVRGAFLKDYTSKTDNVDLGQLAETFYTFSKPNVVRGLHFQRVKQQPKLVRCLSGHVWDVVVDIRPDSPTYGQWEGFHLNTPEIGIFVPAGFAHGYFVYEQSIVSYKCLEHFYGEYDDGIFYNDPDLKIAWPRPESGVILSTKDRNLQSFAVYSIKQGKPYGYR